MAEHLFERFFGHDAVFVGKLNRQDFIEEHTSKARLSDFALDINPDGRLQFDNTTITRHDSLSDRAVAADIFGLCTRLGIRQVVTPEYDVLRDIEDR